MGDISNGLPPSTGYQSPESRRIEALATRVDALAAEVDRLLAYVEGHARDHEGAFKRMMGALNGTATPGGDT